MKELFYIKTAKSFDEGKLKILPKKEAGLFEFVGRTRVANGVKGYVKKLNIPPNNKDVISVSQVGTITAQIRNSLWYASQNIFILAPKKDNEQLISLFVSSTINKSLSQFSDGYSYYPTLETLRDLSIQLPVKSGKIDFDFMKEYIDKLKEESLKKITNYLSTTGLNNCQLTKEDKEILEEYKEIKFKEVSISSLFNVLTSKKRFDANKVKILNKGKYPYVVRVSTNNGQRGFINEDVRFLNEGNTLSFGQDTSTVFYQKEPYFTGDKIKVLDFKNGNFDDNNALYFVAAITKSFSNFSWGASSFCVDIIENQKINLPVKNGKIDFELVSKLIKIIKKIVIKDVVSYIERKK